MKILVLNGSPKGMLSATLHYVLYLQKKFPEHEFPILHIAVDCEKLERDPAAFAEVLDAVRAADGVLWAFPVYAFLVHAYYKRFIELVNTHGAQDAFRDKYTATLSTSVHFFDHTSHNYMQAICEDWGMKCAGAYSAAVYDLVKKEERERLLGFAQNFLAAIQERSPVARINDPIIPRPVDYVSSAASRRVTLGGKRVTILLDSAGESANLLKMVARLRDCFDGEVETIDLSALKIRAGCDGCFQCGADGLCVLREADDINDLYVNKLEPSDILVMAGAIIDRYLSWRWKLFFDRGFFRPMVPWWPHKQLAFLVSGPLKQLPNLRQIFEGYAELHQANLAGIVTDESEDSAQTDALLDDLAQRVVAGAESGYVKPRSFLGIGGTRIFRDEIWGYLRPIFQVAHRYYRSHGMYDFPQKSLKNWLLVTGGMMLVNLPGVRKQFFCSIKQKLLAPLQKILSREE